MTDTEPYRLTEWHPKTPAPQRGRLFTCGRPGRAIYQAKKCRIDEATIHAWVTGLPGVERLHLVSLLGKKDDDYSEFTYYPFRSEKESGTKPTWQEWLDQRYGHRFIIHEYPTVDCRPILPADLEAVKRCALDLLMSGHTVIVVDSGGYSRTGNVGKAIGYTSPIHC